MLHFSQDVLADAHTLFECPHPRRRSPAKIEKKNNIRALKFNKLNIQNRGAGEKKPWSKDEKPQQTQPMCNARNQTQATVICLEASALATVPSLLPRDG